MSAATAKYIPSLDGIRAISVMLVLVSHAGYGHVVPGGFGVTIFFFLSGYLITTLMLKEHAAHGKINVPYFFLRRIFRLYPPLIVTLLLAYGLALGGYLHGHVTIQAFMAQLFYFANYYLIFFNGWGAIPEGTSVLWSLAVEEHFYLFYPLVMTVLLASFRVRGTGRVLGAFCVLVLAWRIYLVSTGITSPYRTYYATDTRIDSILYGCLMAIFINPLEDTGSRTKLTLRELMLLGAGLAAIVFSFLYRSPVFRETARYSLQGIALIPVFYLAVARSEAWIFRFLNYAWMRKLGVYSYAIYLSHSVIIHLILGATDGEVSSPVLVSLTTIASVLFAWVIDGYLDPYFLKLRGTFRPSKKKKESEAC